MGQPDLFRMPRRPWNAGRMIGAKAPLKPKHIWGAPSSAEVSNKIGGTCQVPASQICFQTHCRSQWMFASRRFSCPLPPRKTSPAGSSSVLKSVFAQENAER